MKHYERLKQRAEHGAWYVDAFLRYGMAADAVNAAKVIDEWMQKARDHYWKIQEKQH